MTADGTNIDKVRATWGAVPPEWVTVLAEACDAKGSSQSAVAKRLGVSSAMVNQALANTYDGRLDKLEQRVRGELMNETVVCPVLDVITKRKCMDSQRRSYTNTNALRIELRRACARCPHRANKDRE